jgi:hypothetical protein
MKMHTLGVVGTRGQPTSLRSDVDAIRQINPAPEQEFFSQNANAVRDVKQEPADRIAPVAADQQFIAVRAQDTGVKRSRPMQQQSLTGRDDLQGRKGMGQAVVILPQAVDDQMSRTVAHDQMVIVEEGEAMGIGQFR